LKGGDVHEKRVYESRHWTEVVGRKETVLPRGVCPIELLSIYFELGGEGGG